MRWLYLRRLDAHLWLLVAACFAASYLPSLQLTPKQTDAVRNGCIVVGLGLARRWKRRTERAYCPRRRRDDR